MSEARIATIEEVQAFRFPGSKAGFSEAIIQAIRDKHVVADWRTVTVSAKSSPNGKELKADYIALSTQDVQGMAAVNGGKIKPQTPKPAEGDDTRTDEEKLPGACDYHDYGKDLEAKAGVRAFLIDGAQGPLAAIKKFVLGMRAGDFDDSAIRKMALESPKFKDVSGLADLVNKALAS